MTYGKALLASSLVVLATACGGGGGSARLTYTLNITVSAGGAVTGSPAAAGCASGTCSRSLLSGSQVALTAVPAAGYSFGGWSGACSGTGTCNLVLTSNQSVTATFALAVPAGPNVLPLTVNGATCGSGGTAYPNKPCVSVTVCLPGTSTCAVVDDVVLDTGSYGLRIFSQALPFSLPLSTAGSFTIAECIQYVDGSSDWGPVASADVVLGGEAAIPIAVQVIDATFGPPPSSCPSPQTGPTAAGYQGILGVGPFAEDCGPGCAQSAANGVYFACAGGTCSGTAVQVSNQVPNPVAKLATDGNGVIVDLPAVPLGGALTAGGALILGIDTRANNSSAGATAYPGDLANGEIRTTFDGATTASFLDTGSNGLFFAPPSSGALPACASPNNAWYCPAQTTSFTATNSGASGSPSGAVSFWIGNALSLFGSGNAVFSELGGSMPGGSAFDFGLPFFLGRPVYVGIAGTTSSLGTGPYYAY